MQEYTISFTFSRDNYDDVTTALWKEYFRGVAGSFIIYTILPFVIFTVYCLSNDNPLALICSIGLALFAIVKWFLLFRYRRRFFEHADDIADRLEHDEAAISYSFTDDWIEYRDNEKKLGFTWKLFNDYEISDNCLLIKFDGDNPTLVISRIDIGETAWEELQQLLEQKLTEKWAILAGN